MYKKIVLKNGLRIVAVPQKNGKAVTVLILVKTGSKYERKEINGISHFLEHMFFKGTKKRPDKIEIAETMDKIGGLYNAFTGEEYTGYYAKVASSQFDIALDWVSDIFLHSLLPAKEMEKEKKVIIEEINMRFDHPMAHVELLWNKLLYGDQPAGWDIAGTKESVSSITRADLVSYMKSQYVASNTIVCVAGNFNMNKAVNDIKARFSFIGSGHPIAKPTVTEMQHSPKCLIYNKKTDQTHLCLGVRSFNLFHKDKYAQEIMACLLGGMMSSRMFVELREKLGLAYYIATDAEANPDTGYIMTKAGVDNQRVELAISLILKEYRKIARTKPSAAELKKTKDNLKGKLALILETSDAQTSFYGLQELLEKKIRTPEEIFKMIDRVTQNDILKVAKSVFKPNNLNLALIGPFEDKEKFEKLLKL